MATSEACLERLDVSAYRIPTDRPESDGTLRWDSTTVVVVEARGGGQRGIGYSYTHAAAAALIRDLLSKAVEGRCVMDVSGLWDAMRHAVRNIGRPGLASAATSAVDTALWDLKARLLELPLVALLGAVREEIPVYGSGGFTSYTDRELQTQLAEWVEKGIPRVKMKVGRETERDVERAGAAREAVGEEVELFVDANGAYDRKQALRFAEVFAGLGVTWFEEPVSSDDLDGLRLIRDRAPAGMEITAGEYGYDLFYVRRMLEAGAVDVLQADITRCGGVTELLRVGALCDARSLPLSGHTAPALHAHVACAMPSMRHLEYFHDHVRIEERFFEGVLKPAKGMLRPDRSRPGMGLEFKREDAEPFRIS
jgi:L-alanine-DL-glutamate epimerase-like enolase superfamily enzyme